MVPPGPEAWIRLRTPSTYICNIDIILFLFLLLPLLNCGRTAGRIKMPLGKNFRRPQIFSVEISGPKVVLVLLCKFLFYQAVWVPLGARALRLQPHQPHGWSGPGTRTVVVCVMTLLVNVYTLRVAMSLQTGLNLSSREQVEFVVRRPRRRTEVAVWTWPSVLVLLIHWPMHCILMASAVLKLYRLIALFWWQQTLKCGLSVSVL